MKDRRLDKQTLDHVIKKLVAIEAPRADVIDQVVGDPELFSKIRQRIGTVDRRPQAAARAASVFRRRFAYLSMAMIVGLAIGSILVSSYSRRPENIAAKKAKPTTPELVPVPARSEVPPQPITGKLSAGRAENEVPKVERAIHRQRPAATVRAVPVDAEPDAKFYPVAYTGDPSETAAGGHVIRVDMQRSSLFAMGVNMPLENDEPVVKTDLLVSRDGVTRAVRMVD